MKLKFDDNHIGIRQFLAPDPTDPPPKPAPAAPAKSAVAHHRRAAFAAMRRLAPLLKQQGSSEKDLWDGIKRAARVESRSKFTPENWAIVAARFNAALRSPQLLASLIKEYGDV